MSKQLIPSSEIPAFALEMMHNLVIRDEGGWKLHSNPDDPDGGWTFAGITARLWKVYSPDILAPDLIQNGNIEMAKVIAQQIYWTEFGKPLEKRYDWVSPMMLSCAVNLGLDDVYRITSKIDNSLLASEAAFIRPFCRLWAKTYIDMVQANAEAWRTWADWALRKIDDEVGAHPAGPEPKRPTVLRATFLEGWLNRVERYRL